MHVAIGVSHVFIQNIFCNVNFSAIKFDNFNAIKNVWILKLDYPQDSAIENYYKLI